MVDIRTLCQADLNDIAAIDVSEAGTERYQFLDGELKLVEQTWQRPFWDAVAWQQRLQKWAETLKPDCYLGAYDGTRLVGIAGLRYQLTPTMAQLTSLYIDINYRRQGVAYKLGQEIFRLSQANGASTMYVSSKPSVPAVGFYRRQGFQPTAEPHPELFAQQPADIHMIKEFSGTIE